MMDSGMPALAVTRENVDALLDAGCLQCAMTSGRWWAIRRNGATKKWKRDATRIAIPYKMGLHGYGTITEGDFADSGALHSTYYRVAPDMVDRAMEVMRRG